MESQYGKSESGAMGDMAGKAQETAGQVKEQAKEQATSRLGAQKDQAVESIGSVTEALRQVGEELRGRDQAGIAQFVDQAVARLDSSAEFIRSHDVNELLGEAEEFARRQPALFAGIMFGAGVLGARFLQSSGRRADAQQSYSPSLGSGMGSRSAAGSTGSGYGGSDYGAADFGSPGYGGVQGGAGGYAATHPAGPEPGEPGARMGYADETPGRLSDRAPELELGR